MVRADEPRVHEEILVRHAPGERLEGRLAVAAGLRRRPGRRYRRGRRDRSAQAARAQVAQRVQAGAERRRLLALPLALEPVDGAVKLTVTHTMDRPESK